MAYFRLIIVLILLPGWVSAADLGVIPYPGSELVSEMDGGAVGVHRIITGSIHRVATQLEPKSFEVVSGIKQTATYQIPFVQKTKVLAEYFENQLSSLGRIVYACGGRTCGSSNYWANSVFKQAKLYGPEQYQYYFLVSADSGREHLLVYIAQRGTGKLFIHIEKIEGSAASKISGETIASAILQQGKYTFMSIPTASNIMAISEVLKGDLGTKYLIVAHDESQENETVDSAIGRTLKVALELRKQLLTLGISEDQLEAFGAGPIAPIGKSDASRIELVKLSISR